MKGLGFSLVAAGVAYLIYALTMDVSVVTPVQYLPYVGSVGGDRVVNLDLMERRQIHTIIASLVTLVGVILSVIGWQHEQRAEPAAPVNRKPNRYDGNLDLDSDGYRLWLADKYKIERNETFEKFVMGDRTFETLNLALAAAHEYELSAMDAERSAIKAQEEEAGFTEEQRDAALRASEEEWDRAKPFVFAGTALFTLFVIFMVSQ